MSPNGKALDPHMDEPEIQVLELLYAPRPNLERKPEQPFLKGLAIGLILSTAIFGLLYLVTLRAC